MSMILETICIISALLGTLCLYVGISQPKWFRLCRKRIFQGVWGIILYFLLALFMTIGSFYMLVLLLKN